MSLVAWSGGMDSTLVLLSLAWQYKSDTPPDKYGLRTVSFIANQIPAGAENRLARERVLKKCRARGLKIEACDLAFDFTAYDDDDHKPGLEPSIDGLSMPPLWLGLATSMLHKDENLYLGYVAGDCFWAWRHHFEAAFEQLQAIAAKTGKLVLPLMDSKKHEVIQALQNHDLYKSCWYCEQPVCVVDKPSKPCGNCDPCLTHQAALHVLSLKAKQTKLTKTLTKDVTCRPTKRTSRRRTKTP